MSHRSLRALYNVSEILFFHRAPGCAPRLLKHTSSAHSANSVVSALLHRMLSKQIGAIHCISYYCNQCHCFHKMSLLAAGADPNGTMIRDLDEYSVRFIRGRDPHILLCVVSTQKQNFAYSRRRQSRPSGSFDF